MKPRLNVPLLLLCLLALAALLFAPRAHAQRYQTNDMTLTINSVTAGTASNSTTIANSGGFTPSFIKIPNPAAPFDVFVDFTCNTQVFWGATFLFSGSADGSKAAVFGGGTYTVAEVYPQLFQLRCQTNATGVSNYVATFRSSDTNLFGRPISWGGWLAFHGATNTAPTTLTINRITIGQVQ